MDLYHKMFNIVEKEIEKAIKETKEYLGSVYQKCKLYASMIHEKLQKENISSRILNTKEDLGLTYEHEAVLVFNQEKYYLIDPTFHQFFQKIDAVVFSSQTTERLKKILEAGIAK